MPPEPGSPGTSQAGEMPALGFQRTCRLPRWRPGSTGSSFLASRWLGLCETSLRCGSYRRFSAIRGPYMRRHRESHMARSARRMCSVQDSILVAGMLSTYPVQCATRALTEAQCLHLLQGVFVLLGRQLKLFADQVEHFLIKTLPQVRTEMSLQVPPTTCGRRSRSLVLRR
jgi:hypothetical protein